MSAIILEDNYMLRAASLHVFIALCLWAIYPQALSNPTINRLKQVVSKIMPVTSLDDITVSKSPIPNLYEITAGTSRFYIDESGTYVLDGSLYNIKTRLQVLSKRTKNSIIAKLKNFDSANLITYGDASSKKALYVFTDYTCPYCQKFHRNVRELVAAGIQVRYILISRSGPDSRSGIAMNRIFCAPKNTHRQLLDQLMTKGTHELAHCPKPIMQKTDKLADSIQLSGTPMVITQQGKVIGGFIDVESIKREVK